MIKLEIDQTVLDHINYRLQQKCPNMSIRIRCSQRLPDCYLYLFHQNSKVSQIQLDFINIEDGIVQMLSDTFEPQFRRHKFNMLLRCVLLLLLPSMKYEGREVQLLESHAQNPISAYALLRMGASLHPNTSRIVRQKITSCLPVSSPIDIERKQVFQITPQQRRQRQTHQKDLRHYLNVILKMDQQQELPYKHEQHLNRQEKLVSQIVLIISQKDFETVAVLARHRLTTVFQQLKCVDSII